MLALPFPQYSRFFSSRSSDWLANSILSNHVHDLIALVFPGRPGYRGYTGVFGRTEIKAIDTQVDSFPQILLDVVLGQNFTTKFLFQGFAEIPMMRNMEEFNSPSTDEEANKESDNDVWLECHARS